MRCIFLFWRNCIEMKLHICGEKKKKKIEYTNAMMFHCNREE